MRYNGQPSILGICGENRQLGGEAAVVHFEDGFDHVGDVLGAELGGIFFLLEARDLGEIREDFAGIDPRELITPKARLRQGAGGMSRERKGERVWTFGARR